MLNISNFKLGIGFPLTFTHVPSPFFISILQMQRPDFALFVEQNGAIDDLRNLIVRKAQLAGCSHLIMMDTDQTYKPDTIPRLLAHRLPIVGAVVHRRYPPFDPIMYRGELNKYKYITEFEWGDLVRVDATGTGCLMFDMRVFDKIKYPWFKFTPNEHPDHKGEIIGEDIWFCHQCQQVGIPIHVDTSIPAGHLSTLEVTKSTYELYNKVKFGNTKPLKRAA